MRTKKKLTDCVTESLEGLMGKSVGNSKEMNAEDSRHAVQKAEDGKVHIFDCT